MVIIGGVDEVPACAVAVGPHQLVPIHRRRHCPRLGDLLPALGEVIDPVQRQRLEGDGLAAGRVEVLDCITRVEDAAGMELEIILHHLELPGPGIRLPGGIDIQPVRPAQIVLRANRRINRKLGRI